jgi:pimeloyl-ACP methyl ester carboxylesterase
MAGMLCAAMSLTAPQTIELDGRRLAWRTVGRGPPLLLVNGYAATGRDWDPYLLTALAQTFELICVDNRGMGDSQLGHPAALTVDAMAHDLEQLLDALGLERTPVAGWSMGGFVAQRLAVRSPARVERLVLLASDPGGRASVVAEPEAWALLVDHSGDAREQATRLLSVLFPPEVAAQVDRQFGPFVAAARATLSPQTLAAQEAAMVAWHVEEQDPPGDGAPPVLVAHGDEDVLIPPANADALAARWPGARVERFAGGGHAFMAQEPRRLAQLIADFAGD